MLRLKHHVKLMGVVMMSGLLVWLSAGYPVVSQVSPLPRRGDIAKGLQNIMQTLTAAQGDILDVEKAVFLSHPRVTWAYIPLHPTSRSLDRLMSLLIDKEPVGPVDIGALYLEEGFPGLPELGAGLYRLQISNEKLIALDSAGNDITIGTAKCHCVVTPLPPSPPPGQPEQRGFWTQEAAVIDEGNPFFIKIALVAFFAGALGAGAVTGCQDQECRCNCNNTCGGGGGGGDGGDGGGGQ